LLIRFRGHFIYIIFTWTFLFWRNRWFENLIPTFLYFNLILFLLICRFCWFFLHRSSYRNFLFYNYFFCKSLIYNFFRFWFWICLKFNIWKFLFFLFFRFFCFFTFFILFFVCFFDSLCWWTYFFIFCWVLLGVIVFIFLTILVL